jgi:RNA polymerase sigma-70 factor (ECF subfamily)
MISTDEQLLAQAKQLDPAALEALHRQFYGPVARYIQFKVNDPRTVEDLSGEVFVRVLEGLRKGYGWQDSPRGWIMGIARNVVVDYYRKRERVTEVMLDPALTAAENGDPTQFTLKNEQHEQLRRAIGQLTDEQRDVILMRFMEGIDIKGVAKAVNKSPGAIKGLQFRALRALADLMQPHANQDAAKTVK